MFLRNLFLTGLLRAPEDGGEGGGGGGDSTPRTFTQEDLDRTIGKIKAEERKRFSDYEQVKAQAAKASELETRLAELQSQFEEAGKTAEEKVRLQSERAARAQQKQLEELATGKAEIEKDRDGWKTRFINGEVFRSLAAALDVARVLPDAREDAVDAFRKSAEIEHDELGKITSIEYDGVPYKTVQEAAAAFLKNKKHFADAGRPVGGGSRAPNAGGSSAPSLKDMTAEQAFALARKHGR